VVSEKNIVVTCALTETSFNKKKQYDWFGLFCELRVTFLAVLVKIMKRTRGLTLLAPFIHYVIKQD